MADVTEKLSAFTTADAYTDNDFLVGVRIPDSGANQNFKYSPEQIATLMRQPITVGVGGYSVSLDGLTVTGPYFGAPITWFGYAKGFFQLNVDFTQDVGANSITFIDGSTITNGRQLVAFK